MNAIDDAGLDLVGIYHSHTSSPAYPSRTDAEQAFWPDAVYVIVSLAEPEADVRGYRIRDMAITEEALQAG
jgi:proteasome lid subunit RPN8/RPN11